MRNVSDKSCGEYQNAHFMFSNFSPKISPFMRYAEKHCRVRQARDDNMAHAHCMLDNEDIAITQRGVVIACRFFGITVLFPHFQGSRIQESTVDVVRELDITVYCVCCIPAALLWQVFPRVNERWQRFSQLRDDNLDSSTV